MTQTRNQVLRYLNDNFKHLNVRQKEDKNFYVLERPTDVKIEDFIVDYLKSESVYVRVESDQIVFDFSFRSQS